jgi:hypothetical protein
MKHSVVQCGNFKVCYKVDSFQHHRERRNHLRTHHLVQASLFPEGNQVAGIETLDVLGNFSRPICDDRASAAMATWLIAKFSCKNGG